MGSEAMHGAVRRCTERPQRGRDLPVNFSAARSEKGPTPAFAAAATNDLKWCNLDLQLRRRRCLHLGSGHGAVDGQFEAICCSAA